MKTVILIKLEDSKFEGNHPNQINPNYQAIGILLQEPIVGQSCCVHNFCTSIVTEIIDDNTFKTLNSTYKIEYIGEVTICEYNPKNKNEK